MMDITELRKEFPVTETSVFLNHAGVAPLPGSTARAMEEYIQSLSSRGPGKYSEQVSLAEKVRATFARLINAEPDEIAFVKNTSEGLCIAANGLQWEKGDNVIISNIEFPANVYPWLNLQRFGVDTRFVIARGGRIPFQSIEKLIDERTRLISLSSVEFISGFRNNLRQVGALCREHGIYFCVDAIQSLGVFPMDVKEFFIDFLSADGHKWMLGPEGLGGFFCSKRLLNRLHPVNVGWKSVVDNLNFQEYDFTLQNSARRFEEGTLNTVGIVGFGASLELLMSVGIEEIKQRVLHLTDHAIHGLKESECKLITPLKRDERSGIVSFRNREKAPHLYQRLQEQNIIVSLRGDAIRISPHFYNTEEEIDRLLDVIARGG